MQRIRTTGAGSVIGTVPPPAPVFVGDLAATRAYVGDEGNIWDLVPRDEG
ncbi:hypothetical protein ACQSMD_31655 [Streptomyces flavovirens]|nr:MULTISPECIES: hypothetical protein [unclassified Streptomyces]MYU37349.1 hypothetical protein [Streptomyces sp. SID8358]MYX74512.1 hypothetical protein [Streptomyces sp. SID3915]SCD39793.1 hypothetical protein GA0115239_101365 [Streptomyces sp. BpilaLS-43]